MVTSSSVKYVPDGYHTVTTLMIVRDSIKFTSFMKDAFGAVELAPPLINKDGSVGHAEVKIGDSVVMMFDAKPDWQDTPAFLRLHVEDCHAFYQQALKAGATSVTKPTHLAWGDLVARVRDPFGNIWWIQTRIKNVDQKKMQQHAADKKLTDAMGYVQNADFSLSRTKIILK